MGFFSEEQQRHIATQPLEEQKRILATAVRWSKDSPTALEQQLNELIRESLQRLGKGTGEEDEKSEEEGSGRKEEGETQEASE